MERLTGIGGSGGLVFGRLHFFDNSVRQVGPCRPPTAAWSWNGSRRRARRRSASSTRCSCARRRRPAPDEARIFEIHRIMLTDPDFEDRVTDRIVRQGLIAEYAVQEAGRELAQMLAAMDDAYMRERSADVTDVCNGSCGGCAAKRRRTCRGAVRSRGCLAARHLLPSEVVRIERGRCLRSSRPGARRCPTPASSRARWGCPP